MNRDDVHGSDAPELPRPRMYSPSLQPLLQSLMSTLANMDFEYEREREQICVDPRDGSLKRRVLQKLHERHEERRRPYVDQLTLLQDRISQSIT